MGAQTRTDVLPYISLIIFSGTHGLGQALLTNITVLYTDKPM